MTDDVLEEWHRLADRIARVPRYDFGEPFTPREREKLERVRLLTTDSVDDKSVQANSFRAIIPPFPLHRL